MIMHDLSGLHICLKIALNRSSFAGYEWTPTLFSNDFTHLELHGTCAES
jgi:hypothetical protein